MPIPYPPLQPDTAAGPARLVLQGISKAYPTVVANHDIGLVVRAGEIRAILGENGAVGGLLYAALLLSLLLTAARLPAEVRHGCYVVCATWLVSHFITHSLMEFRYLILPLAWAGGLDSARTARANPPLHP